MTEHPCHAYLPGGLAEMGDISDAAEPPMDMPYDEWLRCVRVIVGLFAVVDDGLMRRLHADGVPPGDAAMEVRDVVF
ncbi:hypothetical protein Gdia_2493 [Gluconacetobacter diazotrophicus PA1 5]|uniref:hypothetical protein n=1 Tax=Gluconacetobacter diazotrophicus TaxID=33996 RepID=UPI000173D952|nr:hypothetical protein [Gluconacetobacter diazotrophicus]ACI52237.1 hypothetical protein Gdia_2493 [Gluconacetobacter diazotrophicus PA1 5]